jgi:CheY-specific phosphatase CheX
MAAKFFGQFLLENGLIDSTQLLEALEYQRASNPVLGELAVARGWLAPAQAARINERQRAEDRPFGVLAEEMGLLDAAQVAELLDEQKRKRKLFGEILVERGVVTRAQLDDALAAHHADRDDAARSLELGLAGHPLADVANTAISACSRLFPRLLKSQCQFSSLLDTGNSVPRCDVLAQVRIDAARPLMVAAGCNQATAITIACGFLGIPAEECDAELAQDALGEFVNVLMGYIVKDVLPEDMDYRASPPDFHADGDLMMHADRPTLVMAMTSQLGPLLLAVRG